MITQEQVEQKQIEVEEQAAKLSETLKFKVHPMIFIEGDEFVIGYLREPDRATKTMYLDKAMQGLASASTQMVELLLLKDEGDAQRILKNDNHFFGAAGKVNQIIQASQDQFKKK